LRHQAALVLAAAESPLPPSAAASGVAASGAPGGDLIEEGLQFLEPFVQSERSYPDLATLLGGVGDRVTLSGTDVAAYPPSPNGSGGEVSISRVTPLPGELMEKLGAMQTNCLMGVFPEASRAWLTVDNEFFLWNYEDGSDLAYYDGLQDAIVAVGFVQPRRDVFADEVHHLLCLATPLELAVLGVSYQSGQVHLLAEPLLRLPTDGQVVTCIEGSRSTGRLFAGTQSGCLLEVAYEERRRPVHVPSFISSLAAADDPICQVCVDDSRRLVYTRSQESTVFAYALSAEAGDTAARRVAALRGSDLAAHAARIAHMVDRSCLTDIVHLSPLTAQHSAMLYLMAVTGSGVRFYFDARLRLAHVRLGPMCPSLPRLADIRLATESRGTVLMLASRGEDRDTLYVLSPDPFPRRPQLQRGLAPWPCLDHVLPAQPAAGLSGHRHRSQLHDGPLVGRPYPPVFLTQHVDPVRRFLLVSVHGLVLLELQTPLMRLAGLLAANQPDSRPVTDWFAHFGPEESSCVCLILACCCDSDDLVRERALAAVMLHGTAAAVR
uniref:Nucleoporin_N domain-containing protein n=1 Tax=Macrostomum lignano TaxID=282301 RepID=A0A1I8IFS2_9PLAT